MLRAIQVQEEGKGQFREGVPKSIGLKMPHYLRLNRNKHPNKK
jgi:hypothetical protein